MRLLHTLGFILSFCGFALSAKCNYTMVDENKYSCLMSDSSVTTIEENENIMTSKVFRVTTIDAAKNELIQAVLEKFANLEILQIQKGNIDTISGDNFPDEKCAALKELEIWNGTLNNIPVSTFEKCPNLESIDLTDNKITTAVIGSFPINTKNLILANNEIKMDPAQSTIFTNKTNLKHLIHLSLSGNDIDTLSNSILPTEQLIHLDLSKNKLESIPDGYFSLNTRIETLHLNDNNMTSIPKDLFSKLINLKELRIESNNISSINAEAFNENKALKYLDMSSNSIVELNENILKNLTTLKTLDLHDIKLTGSSLEALKITLLTLKNLEKLDISNNGVGQIDGIFSKNVELVELNISSMNLSELKGDTFSALKKLQTLNFDANNIAELPENIFETTTEMKTLSAKSNKLARLKASTFEKMTKLETLDFTGNEIDAIESTFFEKLENLKVVRFSGENKCIKADFENFELNSETKVKFQKCFDNYNSAHTIAISNVLLALVIIFKFI